MVRIESVSTSGFKAIEDFEFDAKGINIVTGPNNSGKTSLLESIYTAYNPGYIDSFGENKRYLVNQECEQAVVETAFSGLEEEVEGVVADGEEGERTLCLWSPDQEEALTVSRRVLDQMFEMNRKFPLSIPERLQTALEEQDSVSKETFFDTVRQSTSDVTDGQMLNAGVSEAVTVVEVDGTEYQHAYLGDAFETVESAVVMRAVERILEETDLESVYYEDHSTGLEPDLHHVISQLTIPRSGHSTFVDERPPEIPGVNFLEQPLTELSEIDMSEENAGVRLSSVEQFIKDNDMLPGLEELYQDKFVFSGEDEPYDVPPEFVGDGLKTVIGVLWELLNPEARGNVVLMEEPEKHMHPGYVDTVVRKLVQLAMEDGTQLFVSSHDPDFIESFLSDTISDERVAYLEDEFQVVQLSEGVGRTIDYEDAKRKQIDLGVDLRGM